MCQELHTGTAGPMAYVGPARSPLIQCLAPLQAGDVFKLGRGLCSFL